MTSLPTGAVTFTFTDIEGSTTRWERDRAAMQNAVRRHDAILRAVIAEHGGQVFKTIGDAFCAAFTRIEDAVAAMAAVQHALAAEDFSAVDGLRVRAAVNTGSADERECDYFGPTVNKVARLLAIGHGGQILLSRISAELVSGHLPPQSSLRDLGSYHLKDIAEPEQVHQLVASGLPAEFPPLRSLGTLPSDLTILDAEELRPVASFSGREEELAALGTALSQEGGIVVIHGLGGVGKSSVAREYAWRNREQYSIVWWLGAQTENGIIDGLLRLGAMFERDLDQLADRRAAARRVINSLLGGLEKPILMVFDNLEEEGLMRRWLPRTGSRALLTSRNAAWSADVTPIALQAWALDTAIAYLQRESGRTDLSDTAAHAIAERLGALPLALAHAAASLRQARVITPERYLDRVNAYLKSAPRSAEYPQSVFATFNTAIAQAEKEAGGAAAVLAFAALFDPDAIPDELFRQPIEKYAEGLQPILPEGGTALDLRSAIADDLRLDEALGALDRLSLLSFSPTSRTNAVHRLVQLAARDSVAGTGSAWSECAATVADSAFPEVDFPAWPQCERLLAHARSALNALPRESAFLPAGRLAGRCAVYLRERGEYTGAEPLQRRALSMLEAALGCDHPEVGTSLNDLAQLRLLQGSYAEAESRYAGALAIFENQREPDPRKIGTVLNSLSCVYYEQGGYERAEPLLTRVLTIWEESLGSSHPNVARALNNLAGVYYAQGRYDEAETYAIRALTVAEVALGHEHPQVATYLNNVAEMHFIRKRYDEAEPLLARALTIWEQAGFGPEHPDIAMTLNVMGDVYEATERYEEAESVHTRALAIREKILGPDHQAVATSLNGLANANLRQRRYEKAETMLLRAKEIREKALGPDHPDLAIGLRDLAGVYEAQGRLEEARTTLARAATIGRLDQ